MPMSIDITKGTTIIVEFEQSGELHKSAFWTTASDVAQCKTKACIAKMLKDLHQGRGGEILKITKLSTMEYELSPKDFETCS